jgi:hypothetical protein
MRRSSPAGRPGEVFAIDPLKDLADQVLSSRRRHPQAPSRRPDPRSKRAGMALLDPAGWPNQPRRPREDPDGVLCPPHNFTKDLPTPSGQPTLRLGLASANLGDLRSELGVASRSTRMPPVGSLSLGPVMGKDHRPPFFFWETPPGKLD